jgi:hypothetical protein
MRLADAALMGGFWTNSSLERAIECLGLFVDLDLAGRQ